MNPETLFKIQIIAPSISDGDENSRYFVYYVSEDCNFPEKAIERAINEYQKEEYSDAPFWNEIKIQPLEGKLLGNK